MKKLVTKVLSIVAMFSLMFCSREGVKERPTNIVPTGARAEIYQKIMAQFPESKNVRENQKELFEPATMKHVVLTQESAVYVTFISEGASYGNTFGWYAYNSGSEPTQPSDVEKHVLFPHVSGRILQQGDRLQLGEGTFPAGTVIGFFLIIKGWEQNEVKFDRETFYTNSNFNTDNQQQHVLFQQKDLGDIVLTFEDVLASQASDEDYNDIIFTVSDNTEELEVTKFDLANVLKL